MDPEGRSNTNVGKILGIVGTALLVFQLLAFFAWFAFVGFVVANAPGPNAPAPQPVFKAK